MIKAITFDLDGVYFPNGKTNFIQSICNFGVSEDEVKRVFLKSPYMNEKYKVGKMTDDEFWTWAAHEWNLTKSPNELITLMIDGYDVDDRVAETVRTVRKNGYKTLICSSNFPARINGLQKKFGFLDDFDVAVLSYQVGENKPSPKLFSELIVKAGVKPEEIVFADDYEPCILSAKNLGITALYYENFDKFIEELKNSGVNI
ncbi:hypothetical protein A2872_00570 [Candidatus Gottesmanbacteria bacterium RIFCSPHIGHO2_01_FULL_42_12]|uniref:FCP1 homology domain-containing protein n=1 Tax=Candidatus Gottesmanbacteria bacterium RIFCSPHIGHO2_01_FULL_42_12 TaxID=1798377 RepID=A0A1F5Z3C0_9BACT|nr:MAG: hypothetical protein A2872_00570 [Candidatus Gottesmanbacteria bacterium RIFCSPHIGHO2_01_FULL_42_12]